MLAKSKVNSIETLLSQAVIDMERSYEEFDTIMKEKEKYVRMKENVRNVNKKEEIVWIVWIQGIKKITRL